MSVPLERTAPARPRFPARLVSVLERSTVGTALVLAGVLLLAVLLRLLLVRRIPAPWIMGDELLYSELARSFAENGDFVLRGTSVGTTYGIYPVLISPAWLSDSTVTAYAMTKVINVVLMTLSAVPLYFWARRFLRVEWALGAIAVVLLLPAYSYTGTVMTENAAFPAFCLAFFAIALALERPTWLFQVAAIGAILLACAARIQGVVFFAVLLTAIALKLGLDTRAAEGPARQALRRGLRAFLPTGLVLLGLAVVYALYELIRYGSLLIGLGVYKDAAEADYSVREVARWAVFHLAELGFAVAIIPVSALIVLFGLAWTREFKTTAAERAFLAVTVASFWIPLQAAAFASKFIERIEERNMFYVEPLLLLALALWIQRGAPRPPRLTAVAVLVPSVLLVSLPIERFFDVSIFADSTGLLPLYRVSALVDGGADGMRTLLVVGVLAAALFFVLTPKRLAVLGLVGVAVFLAGSTKVVVGSQRGQALAARAAPGAADRNWIDDAVEGRDNTTTIFTSDFASDAHPVWQTEFWNNAIGTSYYLGARDFTWPGYSAQLDPRGRIVGPNGARLPAPRYVVAAPTVDIVGQRLGSVGRLALIRPSEPLRLGGVTTGLTADGWVGADAVFTRYTPARRVDVVVARGALPWPVPPARTTVQLVELGGSAERVVAARSAIVKNNSSRTLRFRGPRAPFAVRVHVDPTFSPADYGAADTRQLGAQVSVQYR